MGSIFRRAVQPVPIAPVPPPPAVMLYLDDFCGGRCRCLVQNGDSVRMGQAIGLPVGHGAPVHASVSGVVRAVGGGAVVIENDFRDTPCGELEPLPVLEELPQEALRQRLAAGGLLTADGQPLLPAAGRLCHALALDLLLREDADPEALALAAPDRVFGGLRALIHVLQPQRTVVVWDRSHPEWEQLLLRWNVPAESIAVDRRKPFPMALLTGHALEPGLTAADLGCFFVDAQGAAAAWDLFYGGQPYLRRQVLLAGPRRGQAVALTAPLGTAVCHLLAAAQVSTPTVLLGSAAKGRILRQLQTPIGKLDGRITCLEGVTPARPG